MRRIPILTLSIVSAGAILANRLVGFDDAQINVAGKAVMGRAEYAASAAGKQVAVDVLGTAPVEAGAALAKGQLFMSDGTGRAVPVAGGGAVAGRALHAVAAAGQLVESLLIPNNAA